MPVKSLEINGDRLDRTEILAKSAALRRERETAGQIINFDQRLAFEEEALAILIDRTLLVQEARRLGLILDQSELGRLLATIACRYDGVAGCRADADTPESREDLSRRWTVERVLERWRSAVPAPRGEEVRTFYSKNKGSFYAPEMAHASHFVRACAPGEPGAQSTESEVNELRKRVLAGEDFSALAAGCSDCPQNGGDLGWFARGVMVEEFDALVFTSP